ncbi:MAG: Flp pilus assembly protein CpaB [Parvibaculaceae bacterium]
MNAARMGVLVLAVVAAGLAALLARGLVSSGDSPTEAKVVEAPTSQVLVAAANIERGDRLSGSSMRWQSWPETAVSEGFITRAGHPDGMSEFEGSLARVALTPGEPITSVKVVSVKSGGFLAALIAPGKRAVAITVSPETGAGGFILPNDRVDIIQTRRTQQDSATGSHEVIEGSILLQDIRVLAIDQRFQEEGGSQVAIGKTATLELSAAQAERLTVAQAEGALTLSLRGLSEARSEETVEKAPEETQSSSISVVRYGTQQTVRVR